MATQSSMLDEILTAEQLTKHLEKTYSIKIQQITSLDNNIYRIDQNLTESGSWVARVFPSSALDNITQTISLIRYLHTQNFPAEKFPVHNPISSSIDPSASILLTAFIPGKRPERNKVTFFRLGKLLGRLHSLPIPSNTPPGGAWHHLVFQGTLNDEIIAAIELITNHAQTLDPNSPEAIASQSLISHLNTLAINTSNLESLPTSLIHPDLVDPNIIEHPSTTTAPHPEWTVIDWAGSGVGPRIFSLGFLLSSCAPRRSSGTLGLVNAVLKGYYAAGCRLEEREVSPDVLESAIKARFELIRAWEVGHGRKTATEVLQILEWNDALAKQLADRAREVLKTLADEGQPQ